MIQIDHDILEQLSFNLDNSLIFTPINICKDMVDILPEEVFNKDSKFLDIACKSGRFLVQIYCRLMNSRLMQQDFPDHHKRSEYILANQLYGICFDNFTKTISQRNVFGNIKENCNIKYIENYKTIVNNKDKKFFMDMIKETFPNMKFNVVIGNPPYNKGADLDFVNLGFELSSQYCIFITPAKWQTAADDYSGCMSKTIDYKGFRGKIVPHMSYVCFYPCCKDVFNIYQTDGITYYILDKNNTFEKATIENRCNDIKYFDNSKIDRDIKHRESLLNIGNELIDILGTPKKFVFNTWFEKSRYELWMNTKVSGYDWYDTKSPRYVTSVGRILDNNNHDVYDSEGTRIFASDIKDECESFLSYINTKFVRFLLMANISKLNGIWTDDCFRFVPAPPSEQDGHPELNWNHIYTDQELYEYFKLPQKYIDVIEAVIKERNYRSESD